MPGVKPTPPRRPSGPPPRRPAKPATLGQPRNLTDRPSGLRLGLRRLKRRVRPVLYGAAIFGVMVCGGLIWRAGAPSENLTSVRQRFGEVGAMLGLRVDNIIVQGRTTTPEPLLDAAIGVSKGDPLLGFSVEAARGRIATLASVREAIVERRWPGTILVSLAERHPFAVWQYNRRFVLIDRNGQMLADQDVRLAGQLPLVVGAGAPEAAAVLLDSLAAHPAIGAHLVAATRIGERRWNLLMTSGAEVKLPEDGQEAALDRLDGLQKNHQLLDRPLQVIDLRLADRIVLRPDAAHPAVAPASGTSVPAPGSPAPALTPVAKSPRQPT